MLPKNVGIAALESLLFSIGVFLNIVKFGFLYSWT